MPKWSNWTRLALGALSATSLAALTVLAQNQTIYFKTDHIYAGPGGPEIAIVRTAPGDTTAPSIKNAQVDELRQATK